MTKAFDCALRLLARREHGAVELCDKLQRKGFSLAEAREALESCQRLDLQSDVRFAESFIRWRIAQGYGPLKIGQELRARGVDADLISDSLAAESGNWLTYALAVWHKKSRGLVDLSFAEIQKLQRFLLYRGFSMDVISLVLKEVR